MSTTTLSVRLDNASAKQLAELAEATDRPKSWHMEQALKDYLEVQQWQITHIQKGLADLAAGRVHSHAAAVEKLSKWGRRQVKRRRK